MDEALTVNIARLPFSRMSTALRHDGAPPLFYWMLHVWLRIFGTSTSAVRSLPGLLGLLALPLAFLAGRRIGGSDPNKRRWIGWSAVLVVATSPYAIRYSTEVRMYALVMVLVLAGYLAVQMALEAPTIGWLTAIVLVTAALLYTQYWTIFLIVPVGGIQVGRAIRGPFAERRAARLIASSIAVGGVLFIPWLPTLRYQLAHTGTPWAGTSAPPINVANSIIDFAGGHVSEGWILVFLLSTLALLALFGESADASHISLDLRTVAGVRWEWLLGSAAVAAGLLASSLSNTGFHSRYLAVIFPLFILAVSAGLTAFASLRVRVVLLSVLVVMGLTGGVRNFATLRTQASEVANAISSHAQRGDVVGFCPDQLGPAVARLLPQRLGLRLMAWPAGGSPRFVDWVNYANRNADASPTLFANRLLKAADRRAVWIVWAPGYKTMDGRCEQVLNALGATRSRMSEPVKIRTGITEAIDLRRYDR